MTVTPHRSTPSHRYPRMHSIANEIFTSDSYREGMEATQSRRLAIGQAARDLAELETRGDELSDTGHLYRLVEVSANGIDAHLALDSSKGNLPHTMSDKYKDAVIEFNHTLRNTIESNPDISFGELEYLIIGTYMADNPNLPDDKKQEVREIIYRKLNGMRHELAVEDMISHIEGMTCDSNVSVEEEKRGVDMYITFDNREYAVDVKSSRINAEHANARHNTPGKFALWSGLTNEDFRNGSFRLGTNRAIAKSKDLEKTIILNTTYR